jgi:hypothetical protein
MIFPIETYINDIESCSESGYIDISPKIKNVSKDIRSKYNVQLLALYHKLAIATFIKHSLTRLGQKNIPESISHLYHQWFIRVLKDISKQTEDYYRYGNDSFLKDVSVCSLLAIPVGGAWIVNVSHARESYDESDRPNLNKKYLRNALVKLGVLKYFRLVFIKLGIKKLYYCIHTCDRYLPFLFTEREREKANIRIAELLKQNPSIKGLYCSSWFLDPVLEYISPHLTYLRQVPEQNGARVFRMGVRQSYIDKAIALSPKRKKMYAEGKYIPTFYAYIWPRKELIAWAEKQNF